MHTNTKIRPLEKGVNYGILGQWGFASNEGSNIFSYPNTRRHTDEKASATYTVRLPQDGNFYGTGIGGSDNTFDGNIVDGLGTAKVKGKIEKGYLTMTKKYEEVSGSSNTVVTYKMTTNGHGWFGTFRTGKRRGYAFLTFIDRSILRDHGTDLQAL